MTDLSPDFVRRPAWALAAAALLAFTPAAFAHGGSHADPDRWWLAWSYELPSLLGIACASTLYAVGLTRLWRRAGVGRGVRRWQAACFAGGIASLVASLLSPIDALADDLGSVHMLQHMLLMLLAAPLLVAGSPGIVAAWAMPARFRTAYAGLWSRYRLRRVSRYTLWQPVGLWIAFAVVLWVWHVPALYDLALRNDLVHDVQHLAFLLSACLYWRVLFDPVGRVRLTPPVAVAYLFTTSLHAMLLGVFMALSQRVWYPTYLARTEAWGMTPLEDQQVAGYLMWMPGCAIYAVVAAAILGLWLHRSATRDDSAAAAAGLQPLPQQ